jgi:hypothetical protein
LAQPTLLSLQKDTGSDECQQMGREASAKTMGLEASAKTMESRSTNNQQHVGGISNLS